MFDIAWELAKSPLIWLMVITLIVGTTYVAITEWKERKTRMGHNDRDYACRYWWGDRSGSAVGVMNERCRICNPEGGKP